MSLLTAPLSAAVLGGRLLRATSRLVAFPARAAANLTVGAAEQTLDAMERASLVEPPDPPARPPRRREPRNGGGAADS
jgi:hypothetical protein